MAKYVFPNGQIPSANQITNSYEEIFIMEDWHNFGKDYDKTLMAWHHNFNKNWNEIKKSVKYDEKFYRMWNYYLLKCAGLFRAKYTHLWQIVFSKIGTVKEYKSIR